MAQLVTLGMEELFNEMLKMGEDTGQVASDMLEAATPILEKALEQSAIRHGFAAPGKTGRGTGDMIASIDNFGVEMTRDGKLKTDECSNDVLEAMGDVWEKFLEGRQ